MPNRKRLMKLIEHFLSYVVNDWDCNKCPCNKTKYCKVENNNEWEDWECRDGIYEWLMDR